MSSLPTGTVTFLFTDIVGSTQRWRQDDEMGATLARHDALVRQSIEDAGGQWVKHTGDGVMAVFSEAGAAADAAIAIQRGLGGATEEDLSVRIGIHTGEAELRDEDYFGLTVSSAARVMDAGHGGQILVSEATRAVLGPARDRLDLIDLGVHRLKDLGEPQRIFQVGVGDLDDDFPALRTLDRAEHNLPLQLTAFIGREEELADVLELVRDNRLVTLTGVGGAGKTRLALQAAAELVDEFGDGVWFVELASVSDPSSVPAAVAAALGVRTERNDSEGIVGRIVRHLEDRSALLVLDNCEHVLNAAAALAESLLSRVPGIAVLASSREGLGIRGERLYQVPSLRTEGGSESEAARLFLDRARAVSPRLTLTDDSRDQIERVCRLLDGIPLAIELAAARMRVLSPAQIADRLDDRFRLLTGGARAALPRQQTLEAAVDWSYRLLSEGERRLFDRLSVFVGGFTLETAERVCTDESVTDLDLLDLLEGLVDKSMVIADHGEDGIPRYRMLETLRQYGLRRLGEDDTELARWKSHHLRCFAEMADERTPLSWDARRSLGWYATESGNLAAALDWARSRAPESVAPLGTALGYHSVNTAGDTEEAVSLFDEALEHLESDSSPSLRLRAYRLLILVTSMGRTEEFESGWAGLREDLAGADDEDVAWVLSRISSAYAQDPELDASTGLDLAREAARLGEGLDIDARLRTSWVLTWALLWVGGDPAEQVRTIEGAVDFARRHADDRRLLEFLSALLIASYTSDQRTGTQLTDAVEDEMLEIWERRGRQDREEHVMWTGIRRGMWDLAEWEIETEEREYRGRRRVQFLMARACLRWMQGRLDEAERDLDEVAHLTRVRRWHHDYYPIRAEITAELGDLGATRSWVERHFEVPMETAEDVMRLGTLRPLVRAHVDAGDLDSAREVVGRMRGISEGAEDLRIPTVQVGSEAFYLASAEAELTRLTDPDPQAWARAERESFWVYWTLYCRVRRLEARHALGESVADAAAGLRSELEELGAMGLTRLLDRATDSAVG